MKKIITLTLALILALSLAACSFEFGGGTSGGGDPTNSKPMSGDTANSPGDTPNPTDNDAISKNALAGIWGCRDGGGEHFYWDFKADGTFSYYKASTYSTNGLFTRYETYIKGKYRVKDYVIEFYDCQIDSHSGASWKYSGVGSYLDLRFDMLPFEKPLENPKDRDGVSMLFEFIDSVTMRILSENNSIVWGNYDMDFQCIADSHNVAVPTHRIPVPDLAWPTDKLPPEVLAYTDGSIREIDDTSYSREVHIYVERTTREALISYGERLLQAGWERGGFTDLLDGTGDTLWLDRGDIHLHLKMRRDDYVEIAFWYEMGFEKYW